MAKTLNQFLEGYLKVKSADEQKFIDKHVTAKNPDRNGNGDDVFKGSTKPTNRRKERHGYEVGEDEKVYEALKGGQHKIDANKNGKLDAHDFKLLRAKKKVAEEVEELDELSKDTLKKYKEKARDDFYDADDVDDGRRVGQRYRGLKMASKKLAKEESEQIDELSKKTLGSYVVKSLVPSSEKSVSNLASKGGYKLGQAHDDDYTAGEKEDAKSVKRSLGVLTAVRKMTKEEIGQIDELSKKTLGSYVKKAGVNRTHIAGKQKNVDDAITGVSAAMRYVSDTDNLDKSRSQLKKVSNRLDNKDFNRQQGISKAVDRLTKEETESLDELSRGTVQRYSMKAKSIADNEGGKDRSKGRELAARKNWGGTSARVSSFGILPAKIPTTNEEAEGLDELSNATLGSYERKSGSDRNRDAGNQMAKRKQLGSNRVKVASTEMNKTRPKFEETSYASNIASAAAKKYGLAERSQKIDSATLAKLRKEEKLVNLISDISEAHQRTIITVFEKLNDDNKTKFLEACDTPDGVEQMLDFAINNRGE